MALHFPPFKHSHFFEDAYFNRARTSPVTALEMGSPDSPRPAKVTSITDWDLGVYLCRPSAKSAASASKLKNAFNARKTDDLPDPFWPTRATESPNSISADPIALKFVILSLVNRGLVAAPVAGCESVVTMVSFTMKRLKLDRRSPKDISEGLNGPSMHVV